MHLNRRQLFVAACAASLLVPLQACAGATVGQQFTPEAYGAIGDGLTDDYDAFVRLIAAINSTKGGTVVLAPGRTYFINRYVTAANRPPDLMFSDCNGLAIEGNGATIATKGDFHRDQGSTRGLAGLRFENSQRISLRNLRLDGNVHRTTRAPRLVEAASHGLLFQSCSEVTIDGIEVRRFPSDGLYIAESKRVVPAGTRAASRQFTVRNSRFLFNGRQGLSIIQLRGAVFENCEFLHTGYIEPGVRGAYGSHSPAAGVDVEANSTPVLNDRVDLLTGEIEFRGCRMVGNFGTAFVAGKFAKGQRFAERVALHSCHLECNADSLGSRYGFIYDVPDGEVTDCTFELFDRIAVLGWYRQSDASFRFVNNTIRGAAAGRRRPLIEVRRTNGVPVIERNRLYVSERQPFGTALGASAMRVANPNAILRDNSFLPAAAALPR